MKRNRVRFPSDFVFDLPPWCVHNVHMRVIGKLSLESFWKKHPQAQRPLQRWVDVVEGAAWRSFADVRRTFQAADLYHEKGVSYMVFNIGGNKFRLTATIQYARKNIQGVVVILRVETHPEYDRR
jgi:mRNA interferase HigB